MRWQQAERPPCVRGKVRPSKSHFMLTTLITLEVFSLEASIRFAYLCHDVISSQSITPNDCSATRRGEEEKKQLFRWIKQTRVKMNCSLRSHWKNWRQRRNPREFFFLFSFEFFERVGCASLHSRAKRKRVVLGSLSLSLALFIYFFVTFTAPSSREVSVERKKRRNPRLPFTGCKSSRSVAYINDVSTCGSRTSSHAFVLRRWTDVELLGRQPTKNNKKNNRQVVRVRNANLQ